MSLKPITVRLTRGPGVHFDAVLTQQQVEAIKNEFEHAEEWVHFLDYCKYKADPLSTGSAAPFVDKFEVKLGGIIKQHTEYVVAMFWPVIDALCDDQACR